MRIKANLIQKIPILQATMEEYIDSGRIVQTIGSIQKHTDIVKLTSKLQYNRNIINGERFGSLKIDEVVQRCSGAVICSII